MHLQRLIGHLLLLACLAFLLLNINQLPMDEVSFYDMHGHIFHESEIPFGSFMKDSGSCNDILTVKLSRNISSLVCFVIASFVDRPMGALVNLGLGDMTFDLGYAYRAVSLGLDSLLEMLPKIAIRSNLPVGSILVSVALLAKDKQGLVVKDLTVRWQQLR